MNKSLFTNPLETSPGLTINDLNKYLPAIHTVEDMTMTAEQMQEGLFLVKCLDGLKQIPDQSIDLIIADPPEDSWITLETQNSQMTLQDYYQWNTKWLTEAQRTLKNTGGIYLLTNWHYSSMYHGLLSNHFKIRSRITWRDRLAKEKPRIPTWTNEASDIWFATKSDDFLFNQKAVSVEADRQELLNNPVGSNLWMDIPGLLDENGEKPQELFMRILQTSSFKLNWVLDPFMRTGDVGLATKQCGRRFIGFETNKDSLLLAMKRIDQKGKS